MHVVSSPPEIAAPLEHVTAAELARRTGTSRANITQRTKTGRLIRGPDGLYDLADPANAAALTRTSSQKRQADRKVKQTQVAPKAQPPSDPALPAEPRPALVVLPPPSGDNGHTQGGNGHEFKLETWDAADLRKKRADADRQELNVARERGELVDRGAVALVFARVYQVHTGQLKALAQKLGPDIVAAFGLQAADTMRVQELMDLEIRRALAQIKRELDRFLAEASADPIPEAP